MSYHSDNHNSPRDTPKAKQITAEMVRSVFDYDPATGLLTRRARPGVTRRYAGKQAGSYDARGYRIAICCGVMVKVHRVAWLFVHGSWPAGEIDHINGIKDDNRIENLRDVPVAINRQNLRDGVGETGLLGVSRSYKPGTFRASIKVNRKQIRLGVFPSPEAAHAAYVEAKRRLHPGGML